MKRVFLFIITNLAILLVLGVVVRLLGLEPALAGNGFSLTGLLVFAAIFGMGGAFISLAMSKWSAKRMVGAQVIERPGSQIEQWLLSTVQRQAAAAGIGMPEVAIYSAPEINAFATGMDRDDALVAVSTGLLQNMSDAEAEAVLAHEISHIANGDMVTLALIQGVVNTFVIFLSRLVGLLVDRVLLRNERGSGMGYYLSLMLSQLVLGMLASVIVLWFSRQREFRADAGAAALAGRGKMIAALRRLQAAQQPATLPDQMAAFGIAGGVGDGLKRLFMSHPPLEERIAALEQAGGR